MLRLSLCLVIGLLAAPQSALRPDPDNPCESCAAWNRPREPFRIFGNTYYVGTEGLSSLLVTTADGHVLLDGGLTQSAAVIDRNIRTLGFRTEDVKYILASHEHYDHVGGIAALQRVSGAPAIMSGPGISALATGGPLRSDPQYGLGVEATAFPRVPTVRVIADGDRITLGGVSVTAHMTPGHTPGGTSWSWRSCEGERCLSIVYADSLTAVSADGFRFTGGDGQPDITPTFRTTIARIEALPCDIVISTHPGATGLPAKITRSQGGEGREAFVDPNGCRAYAATARTNLERRIAQEAR